MAKTEASPRRADATASLEKDHREVEALFARFEREKGADRRKTYARIKEALALHGLLEEAIFYPAVSTLRDLEAKALVAEAVDEHSEVKNLLAELDMMVDDDPAFETRVLALKETVAHHVEEEETDMFPRAKRLLGGERSAALADRIEEARAARRRSPPAPERKRGR
jgi:hemerythrin superfamily protein